PGSPQAPSKTGAEPTTPSVTRGGSVVHSPNLTVVSQTSNKVTVGLDASPPVQADWTIDGTDRGTSQTVEFDCGPGTTVQVQAVVADTPGANGSFTAYYRLDPPSKQTENRPRPHTVRPHHTPD